MHQHPEWWRNYITTSPLLSRSPVLLPDVKRLTYIYSVCFPFRFLLLFSARRTRSRCRLLDFLISLCPLHLTGLEPSELVRLHYRTAHAGRLVSAISPYIQFRKTVFFQICIKSFLECFNYRFISSNDLFNIFIIELLNCLDS